MSAWRGAAVVVVVVAGCTSPADLQLFPSEDDFGPIAVGATSPPHQFIVTNAGSEVTRTLAASLDGDPSDFALGTDGCSGQVLQPGGSCQVLALFTPQAKATLQVSLTVRAGDGTGSAVLRGMGVDPAALHVTPPSDPHDYGAVLAGGAGQTAVFVVSNDGGAVGGPLSLSVGGADASMFVVGQDRCTGTALGGGTSCTFAVTFRPPLSATGSHSATLQLGAGLALGLVGTALHSAALAWSPPSHDYGGSQVSLDSAAGDSTFQLTNQGNLDSSTITLGTTGDFTVRTTDCGAALTPGAACSATVRFVASAGGPRGGSVTATASAGAPSGVAAALSGTGQWLVQVSKAGGAPGTVTSIPDGITCDSVNTDCSQLYDDQTALTLIATPWADRFTSWAGCTPVSGQPLQCTLFLDGTGATSGAYAVTATFQP